MSSSTTSPSSSSTLQTFSTSSGTSQSSSTSSEGIIPDDYVAFYKFEDNFNDVTGNHNASPTDVTYSDTGGMPTLGKYGIFNGTTSNGQVTDHADITDIKTLCGWVYLNSYGEDGLGRIFQKATGAGETIVYVNSGNGLTLSKNFSTAHGAWNTTSNPFSFGEWYHVCYTYAMDNNVATDPIFYINGLPVGVTEIQPPIGNLVSDTGSDLYLGNVSANTRTFDGRFDNFRIYNRVLSPTEVRSIYNEEAEGIESSSSSTLQTFSTSSVNSTTSPSSSSSSSTVQTFSTSSVNSTTSPSSSTVQTFSTSSVNSTSSSSSSTLQTFSTSSVNSTTSPSSSSSSSSVNSTTSETSISTSTTSETSISTSTTSETSISTLSSSSSSSSTSSKSESTTSISSQSTLDTTSDSSTSTTSETTTSLTSSSSEQTSVSTTSLSSSESSSTILYASEVINRVRKLLNDPDALRYSDTNLIYWLNDAIRIVRSMRYETRLDSNGNLLNFIEITSIDDAIPLDEEWGECLSNYVCYRAFTEIAENKSDIILGPKYKELFYDTLGL